MRDRLPIKQPVDSISCRLSKDRAKFLFTFPFQLAIMIKLSIKAPVAQLDRVLASGAKGRGFKSRLAYQKWIPLYSRGIHFCYMPFPTGFEPRGKRSAAAGGRRRRTGFSAAAAFAASKRARCRKCYPRQGGPRWLARRREIPSDVLHFPVLPEKTCKSFYSFIALNRLTWYDANILHFTMRVGEKK